MKYKVANHVVAKPIAEEAILLDTKEGVYFALNQTGMEIFNACKEGAAIEEIVCQIATRHGISSESVRDDALSLIRDLEINGMLQTI